MELAGGARPTTPGLRALPPPRKCGYPPPWTDYVVYHRIGTGRSVGVGRPEVRQWRPASRRRPVAAKTEPTLIRVDVDPSWTKSDAPPPPPPPYSSPLPALDRTAYSFTFLTAYSCNECRYGLSGSRSVKRFRNTDSFVDYFLFNQFSRQSLLIDRIHGPSASNFRT